LEFRLRLHLSLASSGQLSLAFRFLIGSALSLCFSLSCGSGGSRFPFTRYPLLLTPLNRQGGRVFSKLLRLQGDRNNLVFARFLSEGTLGHLKAALRLGENVRGILISAARLGDFDCVPGLIHLKWNVLEV
jgi:hypothetical protein